MKYPVFLLILFCSFKVIAQNTAVSMKGTSPMTASKLAIDSKNTFAVVVGISDYQDSGIPDLQFAHKDAEAFAGFLQSEAGGSLDGDHLKVLINKEATAAQFAIALDWLMEVVKENDKVIIYFSGHGDVERKTITQPGYLLCWDAPSKVYMAGGALALPMFQDIITTLSSQSKAKVVVITDACRSGKLAGSSVGGSQITGANLAQQYSNEIKILSCQPNEYSIEGQQWGGGRGAFSFNLVNALYGLADNNKDLYVTLQEIGRYLEDHVTSEVAPLSQVPMVLGNKSEKLAVVDSKFLASIQAGNSNQIQLFSSIDTRGMEAEILAGVDSTIQEYYKLFNKTLKTKSFLEPKNACADFYYGKLINEPKLTKLHSTLRRNFAAALQDEAQQELNTMLKTGLTLNILSGKRESDVYKNYPDWLDRAAELLGREHYMYATLQARKAFFSGKIQSNQADAKKYFYEALKWQPDMAHAYVELISTCSETEADSAEIFAQKAHDLVPQWVVPYIRLSHFYKRKLDSKLKSETILQKAGEIDSSSVLVWYSKGNNYLQQRDLEKAIFWFKKSVSGTGEGICFNCALLNLGEAYLMLGRNAEAESVLSQAVQLDSTFGGTLNRLGKVYWLTDRFEMAEAAFRKEIRLAALEADRSMAYNELGNLCWKQNRAGEAEAYYKKSMQSDTTNVNPYWNLAGIYYEQKQYEKAEFYCRKSIQNDSTDGLAYSNLGLICAKTNRPVEAELYGRKGTIHTKYGDGLYEYTSILSMINKLDEAFIVLEKILKTDAPYEWCQTDPDIAPLRLLPKWNVLMKKYFPEKFKD